MRSLFAGYAVCAAIAAVVVSLTSGWLPSSAAAGLEPLIDNPRVVVYRVDRATVDALGKVGHVDAVVVPVESNNVTVAGRAVWVKDVAAGASTLAAQIGDARIVIVQPRDAPPKPPASASKPGDAPFTGMSFKPMFDNDRVSVIRARMEVGAKEGFHAHASDTIVVHLSGGEIEDTADGKTVVNRWKPGDAEFEGQGTSHSARNVGGAVDVVLVALKPR